MKRALKVVTEAQQVKDELSQSQQLVQTLTARATGAESELEGLRADLETASTREKEMAEKLREQVRCFEPYLRFSC